jgi:ATP-binding cassette, subfamily B, bacterial PglK
MSNINTLYNHLFSVDQKRNFLFLIFLMVISSILDLLGISLIIPLVNKFFKIENNSESFLESLLFSNDFIRSTSLTELLIIFFAIFAIKFFYLIFYFYFQNKFIFSFRAKLTSNLFEKALLDDYKKIKKNSGQILNLISNETDQVTNYLSAVSFLLLETVLIIFIVTFLLIYEFKFSLFLIFSFVTILSFYFTLFKKKIDKWGSERLNSANKRLQYINEGIKGNQTIKLFSIENLILNKFNLHNESLRTNTIKINLLNQFPKIFLEFFAIIFLLTIIYYNYQINVDFNYIVSFIGVFLFAFFKLVPSLNRFIGSAQIMRYNNSAVSLTLQEQGNLIKKKKSNNKIDFKNEFILKVKNFRYDKSNENYLLKDIKLEIKKNQKIGLVGPSGVGKSTILDFITGLINPEADKIILDGKTLKNLDQWQNIIGFVPQKIFILEETLKENIAFGLKITDENQRIFRDVIEKANLTNLVEKLPLKENSVIEEDGKNLSGGETQRIGIARALIRKPKILIMDEATSALDLKNEKEIIDDLIKIKDLTIIFVTHRISALEKFDKVYSLENGIIEEKKFS